MICRGMDKFGYWQEGYLVRGRKNGRPVTVLFDAESYFFDGIEGKSAKGWIEVTDETVCRCSGVLDCDGLRIFENDIVGIKTEHYLNGADGEVMWENEYFSLVEWFDGACYVKLVDKFLDYDGSWVPVSMLAKFYGGDCQIKVFGNRFENPELVNEAYERGDAGEPGKEVET